MLAGRGSLLLPADEPEGRAGFQHWPALPPTPIVLSQEKQSSRDRRDRSVHALAPASPAPEIVRAPQTPLRRVELPDAANPRPEPASEASKTDRHLTLRPPAVAIGSVTRYSRFTCKEN